MHPSHLPLRRSAGALHPSRSRAGPRALVSTGGGRLACSVPQPDADSNSSLHASTAAAASAAATAVAPASDLRTRQLRLLPWQTSTEVNPGELHEEVAASQLKRSDGVKSAAGTSGVLPTSGVAGTDNSRARRQRRAATDSVSGTFDRSDSGAASSSTSGLTLQHQAVSPASAACEACGGRRFLLTSQGMQPCSACQQWRQRPDYRPGGPPLLTLQDVDLSVLESTAPSSSGAASSSAAAIEAADGGSSDEPSSSSRKRGSGKRGRKKGVSHGPMSEEQRRAISQALQSKSAKSQEHRRSISRAMREAHARNPDFRRAAVGQKKRCGNCGAEGHNRRACPELLAVSAAAGDGSGSGSGSSSSSGASKMKPVAPGSRLIFIEEEQLEEAAAAAAALEAGSSSSNGAASLSSDVASAVADQDAGDRSAPSSGSAHLDVALTASASVGTAGPSSSSSTSTSTAPAAEPQAAAADTPALPAAAAAGAGGAAAFADLLPTRQLGPGMALCPEGNWVMPLPQTKEECVAQAAQAVLRAWDDGIRRQALELLLPQAHPTEDGGWPGGIRQQFRVAKPMVESLLLRLKQHAGLEGRITAELLDEGDCVAAWQSERLGAVLFSTADTLPDLRRIDDALSGKRLTLVINPQWQTQGQVISDFGIGQARKSAERFVAGFDEVYYLKRVRIFGDDVRIMRCYPGQWQVHYVPPPEGGAAAIAAGGGGGDTVLLSCEDSKPTYQRLIQLLKGVRGSRASKTWLDRFLTSSMGTFNEFAAFNPEATTAAGAGAGAGPLPASTSTYISGGKDAYWAGSSGSGGGSGATTQAAMLAAAAPSLRTSSPAGSASSKPSGSAAAAQQQQEHRQAQPLRDIVTGELLPDRGAASSSGSAAGAGGKPVRDIRLEPAQQLAKWLGSGPTR